MILMIDNYDSFTFNLVRYCQELGLDLEVVANDQLSIEEIAALAPQAILLSPGPGRPQDAGICADCVRAFLGKIPILGICLGHQVICEVFGAKVDHARTVIHGKTSDILHKGTRIFEGLPQGFAATRYHSLSVWRDSLPECLEILAWTVDEDQCFEEIMAIGHRSYEIFGIQFHPEALLTDYGHRLLAGFFRRQSIAVNIPMKSELEQRSCL